MLRAHAACDTALSRLSRLKAICNRCLAHLHLDLAGLLCVIAVAVRSWAMLAARPAGCYPCPYPVHLACSDSCPCSCCLPQACIGGKRSLVGSWQLRLHRCVPEGCFRWPQTKQTERATGIGQFQAERGHRTSRDQDHDFGGRGLKHQGRDHCSVNVSIVCSTPAFLCACSLVLIGIHGLALSVTLIWSHYAVTRQRRQTMSNSTLDCKACSSGRA